MMRRLFSESVQDRLPARLKYLLWSNHAVPTRYRHLLRAVYRARPKNIVEIGVGRALRAKQMIEVAGIFRAMPDISYHGFDLFEKYHADPANKEAQGALLTRDQIHAYLEPLGAYVKLHPGFSKETLPPFAAEWKAAGKTADVIFINGDHAEETVVSDWQNIQPLMGPTTVVLFDDYYPEDHSAHMGKKGCQYLVDSLDRSRFDVQVLPNEDVSRKPWGTLKIRMAQVAQNKA